MGVTATGGPSRRSILDRTAPRRLTRAPLPTFPLSGALTRPLHITLPTHYNPLAAPPTHIGRHPVLRAPTMLPLNAVSKRLATSVLRRSPYSATTERSRATTRCPARGRCQDGLIPCTTLSSQTRLEGIPPARRVSKKISICND